VLEKENDQAESKDAHSLADETKQILQVVLYAFILNIGLVILKATIAFFAGSLAIAASAVDSATDSVASLAVLFGLKLSTRKTKAFPYGLYKIENLVSVIVALFIFMAGYEILRRALTHTANSHLITPWIIGWLLIINFALFEGLKEKLPDFSKKLKTIHGKVIVLTGAMKPARFKSSDAAFNIGSAVAAAQTLTPGVYIAMNGRIFDPDKIRKNLDRNWFEDLEG